ncbi:unnamed protein product [Clavelina lepadiformis]|uniref:Angio-associated migratory cell protein n=1 Tax=Clavelina lepadiformis TaxID=159417 RepID=A0ABP0F4N3_CLALP
MDQTPMDEKGTIETKDFSDTDMQDDPDSSEDNDESPEEEQQQYDNADLIFQQHKGEVFVVDVDKSGKHAVSGGVDDKGYVWEIETGDVLVDHKGQDSVTCACFSADSSFVAMGDISGAIKVWKMDTREEVWEFQTGGDLEWLKWHPVAPVLMAGTTDGEAWLWKIPSGDCKTYQSHGDGCTCGDIFPDGKKAALGYADGSVRIFDLKTQEVLHTINKGKNAHRDGINDVRCSPDGQVVLTASVDGSSKLISLATGKISATYGTRGNQETDFSVEKVSFSNSLPLAATASLNGQLTIWDLKSGQIRHKCQHPEGITSILWNGTTVFSGCLDGISRQWDARSGELLATFVGHSDQIYDLALSSDGRLLLSASADETVRVFDTTSGIGLPSTSS